MTRGFEHRLWGHKVVKIKPPDSIASHSTSSIRSPSPTASLTHHDDTVKYNSLSPANSSVKDGSARDGDIVDEEKGEVVDEEEGNVNPLMDPESGSRERSQEVEDAAEWQIPETVLLTRESMALF